MLDAAQLAAILDPERKVPGWWRELYFIADAEIPMCPREFVYIGPPDLHTAREHAWRGEEWLEARGYDIARQKISAHLGGFRTRILLLHLPEGQKLSRLDLILQDDDHAAALNAAIERISNG